MKSKVKIFTSLISGCLTITPAVVLATSCSQNGEVYGNIKIVNPGSSSLINNIEIQLGNNFDIELTIDQGEFTNEQLESIYQNLQWEVQLFDSNNQLENYKLYINKTDTNGLWKVTNTDENNINTGISEGKHKMVINATANVNDVIYQGTSQINLTVNYTAPTVQQFQYEYVAAGVDPDLPQAHYVVNSINKDNIIGTSLYIPNKYNDGTHGELPVLAVRDIFESSPGNNDFSYLNKITSFYISDGIQKIDFLLTSDFLSLNSLKLPNTMRYLISIEKIPTIAQFINGVNFLTNIEFSGNQYFGFIPGANEGSGIVCEGPQLASDLSNIILAVGDVIIPDSIHELNCIGRQGGDADKICLSYQPATSISLPAITKIIDFNGEEINMNNFSSYDNLDNPTSIDNNSYKLSGLFKGCLNLQKIILRDHGKDGLLEYQYGNDYDSGILMLKGHKLNKSCSNYIAMCGEELTIPEECESIKDGGNREYSRIYVNKLYVPAKFKSFDLCLFLHSQFYDFYDLPTKPISNRSLYLCSETIVNITYNTYYIYPFKIYVPTNLLDQYLTEYSNLVSDGFIFIGM